jgi:hypothetical protein
MQVVVGLAGAHRLVHAGVCGRLVGTLGRVVPAVFTTKGEGIDGDSAAVAAGVATIVARVATVEGSFVAEAEAVSVMTTSEVMSSVTLVANMSEVSAPFAASPVHSSGQNVRIVR